jgi:hypothetical protein
MSNKDKLWGTYKVEDIFHDIPGDPDNVNMTIPPEIAKALGLEPGDPIQIDFDQEKQQLSFRKVPKSEGK